MAGQEPAGVGADWVDFRCVFSFLFISVLPFGSPPNCLKGPLAHITKTSDPQRCVPQLRLLGRIERISYRARLGLTNCPVKGPSTRITKASDPPIMRSRAKNIEQDRTHCLSIKQENRLYRIMLHYTETSMRCGV